MTFFGLILRQIHARPLRALLTAGAVAIGVSAVVALGVLTASLKLTATQLLEVGRADFTVAQKHTDDLINSTISEDDMAAIGRVPGVSRAVGALISTDNYNADNPLLIEVGLKPSDQEPFGVDILAGKSYAADSTSDVMLGYVLAKNIGKQVGDNLVIDGNTYHVTGLYSTNVSFGNSTVMFPLSKLQGMNRLAGQVSLGFVQVDKGASIKDVAKRIDETFPQLTTIRSAADFGRADRNLTLISAANTGGSILAAMIAITGVLNTSLLSFFERIREFGIYRSIGWTRRRVIGLVIGEALVVSFAGAFIGILLGWVTINVLEQLRQLRGIFVPTYQSSIFIRSLAFGMIVAFFGALYPALRAAFVAPLKAVRRE
ncbi:MAG: ABC transporter permease [Acidimicrobiia bacterium]|nr:ABC transporter permease [Acidimicrobiia bacterium]